MSPEEALVTFQAVKLHFTTSYDYFKYHGKTKAGDLETKKDKWNYVKLSRNHGDHLIDYLVANFSSRPGIKWSGDLVGPAAEEAYTQWQKRIESMGYLFKQEVTDLFESTGVYSELFEGAEPLAFKAYQQGSLSLESLIILDHCASFMTRWDESMDDYVWPDIKKTIEKYRPFLSVEKPKYMKIIREILVENN